jgi:heterotetrameric sarcosine oxidase gamma subunit
MDEALLVRTDSAFAQDLFSWVREGSLTPGARRLDGIRVVVVRHTYDGAQVSTAFEAATNLPWPLRTRELRSSERLSAMRCHPGEVLVVGEDESRVQQLMQEFSPGRTNQVVAIDLSHGMGVVELRGPRLDEWLAHVIDQSAIPDVGCATRCRLADLAVHLLRPAADCIRVVADRAAFPYLAHWLAFSHEGAFEHS